MSPFADFARSRLRRRALLVSPSLAVLAGMSLLASACGGSPATSTTSDQRSAALAYSHCMRGHGVPSFPDPDSQGNFSALTQQLLGVSKQTSAAANDACKHLLSYGGGGTSQRQEKLAFGLRLAECLRTHGYPSFPDPTAAGGQNVPPGIDPSSSQFQAAEGICKRAQQKLGLP